MIRKQETIHVAYCTRRDDWGTRYKAVAYVRAAGDCFYHTRRQAIADSVAEAESMAIDYIREAYGRDGLPFPGDVARYGRKMAAVVDSGMFLPAVTP